MRASVLIMAAMDISGSALRCVIVPGNGCTGRVADANWYGWLENELKSESQFREVVLPETMPDPVGAKESVWVPFMRETLKVGADTVVVGHSSGAVAAMRLAEETPVAALVLVSACHTDLGDPGERAAGYYARPWRWDAIRANAGRIVQFHSDNDPFIPDTARSRRPSIAPSMRHASPSHTGGAPRRREPTKRVLRAAGPVALLHAAVRRVPRGLPRDRERLDSVSTVVF